MLRIGAVLLVLVLGVASAEPSLLAPVTTALTEANTEIRGSTFPAISLILAACVLIAVAAAVVSVITRGRG